MRSRKFLAPAAPSTHHFMRHANWVRVNKATFEYLHRNLAR